LQMASEIVTSGCVDEVWIVPCGSDQQTRVSRHQRYVMCELAVNTSFSATFPVFVSDHEVMHMETRPGAVKAEQKHAPMATYDSLCYLRKTYPDCDFAFVLGSDWLQSGTDLREWTSKEGKTGDRMLNEFDFLVLRRKGYNVTELKKFGPRMKWVELPDGFEWVETTGLKSADLTKRRLSPSLNATGTASSARRSAEDLRAVDGLLPPAVLAYIQRHDLATAMAHDVEMLEKLGPRQGTGSVTA